MSLLSVDIGALSLKVPVADAAYEKAMVSAHFQSANQVNHLHNKLT